MTHLLQCVGVRKLFATFVALDGVDLAIKRGDVVGIIGANGAGKTTLFNIISGYLKPTSGQIIFRGQDATGVVPRDLAKRGLARSFQIPQLFASSTVLENMMLGLALLADKAVSLGWRFDDRDLAERARAVLAAYEIDRHAHERVGDVPQGVRKLLDIAMATCAQPDLVLLDEPTSGVGNEEKISLMKRLSRQFRAGETTVVFVEHDMEIVRQYATRVVALYEGKIIADGPAEVVFRKPDVMQLIIGHSLEGAA